MKKKNIKTIKMLKQEILTDFVLFSLELLDGSITLQSECGKVAPLYLSATRHFSFQSVKVRQKYLPILKIKLKLTEYVSSMAIIAVVCYTIVQSNAGYQPA